MIVPMPPREALCLFAPDRAPRLDLPRWTQQAATFFAARVALVQTLGDPSGALPDAARFELDVAPIAGGAATRVRVLTVPLDDAPAAREAGRRGVEAIGGAGFDALLARAARLWQVEARPAGEGDPRAPLVVAALIASVLLAPIVPPGEETIFGVRGARRRLVDLGWPGV